jgi:hypothetical protein
MHTCKATFSSAPGSIYFHYLHLLIRTSLASENKESSFFTKQFYHRMHAPLNLSCADLVTTKRAIHFDKIIYFLL